MYYEIDIYSVSDINQFKPVLSTKRIDDRKEAQALFELLCGKFPTAEWTVTLSVCRDEKASICWN